jgi:hypothetical protein
MRPRLRQPRHRRYAAAQVVMAAKQPEGRGLARWHLPEVGSEATERQRFPASAFFSAAMTGLCPVSSPRPSNRACGSPAHGLPTPFTAGIQPPRQARKGLGATTIPTRLTNPS